MTRPIYLSKTLNTASSNVLGSVTAQTSVSTFAISLLSSITLDTPRRIQFASSVAVSSGITFIVTGIIEGGGTKTEQIFSSTGAAITTLDFQKVTSVSISSATGIPLTIGTNNIGGTRWCITDQVMGGPLAGNITFSSSSNSMSASLEWTMDDPLGNFPIATPLNQFPAPTVLVSSILSGVTGATDGIINVDGQIPIPAYAYRLTITSSSSSAGTVWATVLQQG